MLLSCTDGSANGSVFSLANRCGIVLLCQSRREVFFLLVEVEVFAFAGAVGSPNEVGNVLLGWQSCTCRRCLP